MIKYIDTDVGFIKNIFNWCSRNKLLRVWFTSVKKEIFRFLFLNLLHIVEIVFIILAWFLEDTCNTQYTVIHFCRCFGGQIKTESVNSEELTCPVIVRLTAPSSPRVSITLGLALSSSRCEIFPLLAYPNGHCRLSFNLPIKKYTVGGFLLKQEMHLLFLHLKELWDWH